MRDYKLEIEKRTAFIRGVVEAAGASGIVFANSGGKDCVLSGYLCKQACDDTICLILPCGTKRNYNEDKRDAEAVSKLYNISARTIDLTAAQNDLVAAMGDSAHLTPVSIGNMAARLRMIALNAVAYGENRLVAGTGNRSERYMGYFTKWGDGAFDFNPIADLTVREVYEFLAYIGAPPYVTDKPPSAGLYEGQTDEGEMGVTYRSIDDYLLEGIVNERDLAIINRYHNVSGHKRRMPLLYAECDTEKAGS